MTQDSFDMNRKHDVGRLNEIDILKVTRALGVTVKGKKALCFLHKEKTPSLVFYLSSNRWHCFGCNRGGNVIDLVMQKENLSFSAACVWLEQIFFSSRNFDPSYASRKNTVNLSDKKVATETKSEPNYELYDKVINYLDLSDKAKNYLCEERALSYDVIKSKQVKSLECVSSFYKWLKMNYDTKTLHSAGLINIGENGPYDSWRKPGIVFPYHDIKERIVNLQLRPYDSQSGRKYILLTGVKTCMYNENCLSKLPIGSEVFLCEGAIDTLSMITVGYNAVGLPGVATLKDEWITILSRYNINI